VKSSNNINADQHDDADLGSEERFCLVLLMDGGGGAGSVAGTIKFRVLEQIEGVL
jgi:hypothetical protein